MRFAPRKVELERRADGSMLLRSPQKLGNYARCVTEWLSQWSDRAAERVFLAERNAAGAWRKLSYREAYGAVRRVSQALLARKLDARRPVAILSDNGIDHALLALLALGAMPVGVPVAPVSPEYSLMSKDFGKLKYIFELLQPGLVYAAEPQKFAPALEAVGAKPTPLAELMETNPGSTLEREHAKVGPGTVAKILFTSGSTGTPNLLVVHPSVPVADLKAFIDHARNNAGKLNLATGGMGTLNHLALEQLKADAGFDAVTAHYRGIGPAINDLRGGQVHAMMPGLAAALPHVRAGSMRPIAVTGHVRHPLLPGVPTFEESGFKGYDAVQWYGIVGPAGLPVEITQRLNADINKALATPALRRRLSGEAIEPMPMTPEQFGRFIQADLARWRTLARERKISLDE